MLKCDLSKHMLRGLQRKESTTKPGEHKYQQKACLDTGWHVDQKLLKSKGWRYQNFWELSSDLSLLYLLFFVPLLPILSIGKTVLFFEACFQSQLWSVTGERHRKQMKIL